MSNKSFYLIEGSWGDVNSVNAGNKARDDVNQILSDMGLAPIRAAITKLSSSDTGLNEKLVAYTASYKAFDSALAGVPKGSVVIAQFPLIAHTPFFSKAIRKLHSRGSRIVLLLHDLEMIRFGSSNLDFAGKMRITLEEKSAIENCDALIVHNDSMRDYVIDNFGITAEKVVSLGIFDYLADGEVPVRPEAKKTDPVVVAGNLSYEKSGYIYDLPANVPFRLYGVGYKTPSPVNVDYRGSFPPAELPVILNGGFGLVWDGPQPTTCSGPFGEYLRLNNPHKTSLYLASGMPVVIWDQAALAPFIVKNGAGIAVASLGDLRARIDALSDDEYECMKGSALELGNELRRGFHTRSAVNAALGAVDIVLTDARR